MYIDTYSYIYNYIYINIYIHASNSQPIALKVPFNLNLKSQSHWSLFNGTRQKRLSLASLSTVDLVIGDNAINDGNSRLKK